MPPVLRSIAEQLHVIEVLSQELRELAYNHQLNVDPSARDLDASVVYNKALQLELAIQELKTIPW